MRELTLAIPPTLTVLAVMVVTETFLHQRIVFAPLATSAFLIYREPMSRMNDVWAMLVAYAVAGVVAALAHALFGSGYAASAVALLGTIVTLVLARAMHPPAIGAALGFVFVPLEAATAVGVAVSVMLVAGLAVLQRVLVAKVRSRR